MPQSLSASLYTNSKGIFHNIRFTGSGGTNTFGTIRLLVKYTKNNPAITTLKITLAFRTNNLTANINVAGQSLGTTQLYTIDVGKPTDTNFPTVSKASYSPTGTLGSTATSFAGTGTGYFRYITTGNFDTVNARSFNLTIDGDSYSISLPKQTASGINDGSQANAILWQTPTTDSISEADPAASGQLKYLTDTPTTTGITSDPLTITVQELDGNNEVFSQGSISTTFYWIFIGFGPAGSVVLGEVSINA
jgi:hypothetical protein